MDGWHGIDAQQHIPSVVLGRREGSEIENLDT